MTIEELAAALKGALQQDDQHRAKQECCKLIADITLDDTFVSRYLQPRTADQTVREILYTDPEFGFCICGHVYAGAAQGKPHDHGPSWAIYAQAEGETRMVDWEVVEPARDGKPQTVRPVRDYILKRGDAHLYDVGDVHSPHRDGPVKLVRVEGQNLDLVTRTPTVAVD